MNKIILTLIFLFSGMVIYRLLMDMCDCYEDIVVYVEINKKLS